MKNLLLIIIYSSIIIALSSCTVSHPWTSKDLPQPSEQFEVLEDLSCSLGLQGVYAFKVKKGIHTYLMIDTGYSISFEHEVDCSAHEYQVWYKKNE